MHNNEKITGIARETLHFILEVSKSTYPNEFAGLLEAKDGIISNVLFLPGTESGGTSAILRLFMMPNISTVGSVHSHPSSIIRPSNADRRLFRRTGNHHIIAGHPFEENNWKCFNGDGEEIELKVLDIELENDEII